MPSSAACVTMTGTSVEPYSMANRTPRIVSHAGFPTDESLILTPSSRLHEQKSQRDCHSECDTAWAARTEDAARSAPSGVVDTQRFDSLQHGVNQIRRDNDLADRAWYVQVLFDFTRAAQGRVASDALPHERVTADEDCFFRKQNRDAWLERLQSGLSGA
jgi:hypothetical protein